jgi:hypothetical protein
LDVGVLRPHRHLLKVPILRPQLLDFRPDRIGGGSPGHVDEVGSVIVEVFLPEHELTLKLLSRRALHELKLVPTAGATISSLAQRRGDCTMGERNGKRVLVMPRSADSLRGQQRDAAVKNEALVLQDAILGSLDILDLFDDSGRVVLVANGELQAVNSEHLRMIIEELFVTKHVVRKGLRHEVEYQPVRPNEMAVRALLRAEPRDGGLIGRLPRLEVEQPQVQAPPEPAPVFMQPGSREEAEFLAGQRGYQRLANTDARTELESRRGREVSERYANQRRQAAATAGTPVETVVVESYPIYAPPPNGEDTAAQETESMTRSS